MRDIEIAQTAGYVPLAFDGRALPKNWPAPLHRAALHGLAGDAIAAMLPHTEASEAALLFQLLAAFGSIIGRAAYWTAGADEHHGNLYVDIVGNTAAGRKGSSWSMVENLLHPVDSEWAERRVKSGVSSGEGLIFAVRDAITKRTPVRENGRVVGTSEYVDDPGETDKRLLALEGEFANVLKVATREGNTVSTWLRNGWDGKTLGTLTKNPLTATRPHISLIGHITSAELQAMLSQTDTLNGFANRFLFAASARSKSLPSGGNWASVNTTPLVRRLKAAVEFSREPREIKRDADAEAWWDGGGLYDQLTRDRGGAFGAATGRAETQTMRLAMLYALLDESPVIRLEHLRAGVAAWAYAEASALWLFGESTGNRDADSILGVLDNDEWTNRSEIRDMWSRHMSGDRLDTALDELERLGLARRRKQETRGRPAEQWQKIANPSAATAGIYDLDHPFSAFSAAGGDQR